MDLNIPTLDYTVSIRVFVEQTRYGYAMELIKSSREPVLSYSLQCSSSVRFQMETEK